MKKLIEWLKKDSEISGFLGWAGLAFALSLPLALFCLMSPSQFMIGATIGVIVCNSSWAIMLSNGILKMKTKENYE